jgi:hypothetical protein
MEKVKKIYKTINLKLKEFKSMVNIFKSMVKKNILIVFIFLF